MPADLTVEQKITAEIERLRGQFPNTQDLYREACTLLFFRFGITPTANKLYQLVRKGSMSAPAEALARFWDNLRDKSRVRIEHPDLPVELRFAAGDLTAVLWLKAQELAKESLNTLREESQATVLEAKTAQSVAEAQYKDMLGELESLRSAAADSSVRIQEFQQQQAAAAATNVSLHDQLGRARDENNALQNAVAEARREFSVELEKVRSFAALSEERARASEERALNDIDRERTRAKVLKKELEAHRTDSEELAIRHRSDLAVHQEQIAQLYQRIGLLEGNLQAEYTVKQETAAEIFQLRTKLADMVAGISEARKDTAYWKERATQGLVAQSTKNTVRRLHVAGRRSGTPRAGTKKLRRGSLK